MNARAPALAVLATLGLAFGLSPFAGGYYDSSIWAPAGLVLLAVLTAALVAAPSPSPPRSRSRSRLALAAPALIAALALLSLASALWTDSIVQAVVEGNRLLVYATALALFVVLLRDDRDDRGALVGFAAFTLGAVVVAGCVLTGLLRGDEGLFFNERLNDPLGYINGQASFFVLAFWPCLALAERRGAAPLAGLGLAGATLFAGLATLGQSRGAVLAGLLSLLLVLTLLPGRLRRFAALLVSAACLAPATPALLALFPDAVTDDRMRAAAVGALLAAVAAGVLWTLLVAFEQRASASGMRLRRAAAVGVAGLALVAAGIGVASAGRIASFADDQYEAFVTLGGVEGEPTASRLASGAGHRYDYWRVAVDAWREHPVAGVGAGGYDKPYFAERTTLEDIRQPHSLALQVLVELGIAGALLFVAGLLVVAAGAWRRIRAGDRAPAVVAALGVVTAWLVHASVDWIHLLPGLTGLALFGAAVLLRPPAVSEDAAENGATSAGRSRLAIAIVLAVALAFAAASLGRQALSEHYTQRAQDALPGDPARALTQANRALRLDHEAVAAYYAKAAALARFGDGDGARAVLLDASRREPRNFVTWALLGDLSVRAGDVRAAKAYYNRARRLNPRDEDLAKRAADPRAGLRGAAAG